MTRDFPPAIRGAMFMVVATVLWASMMVFVRLLAGGYSTFEILFFRNAVALILLSPLIARAELGVLRTTRPMMHMTRAVLSYAGMLGLFYAIGKIPLSDVVALSFAQPLFITVLAALLLGEAVGMARWRATAIGFLGILIIVRPGFEEVGIATLVVIAAALLYGGSNICIKALMRTDTPLQAVIYVNLLMLPLSLVPTLFAWTTPGWTDLVFLICVGITGTAAVYMLTKSYQAADASAVVPYDFLRLPFTAAAAYLMFSETGDVWTWLGAAVIFGSSYALVRIEAAWERGR